MGGIRRGSERDEEDQQSWMKVKEVCVDLAVCWKDGGKWRESCGVRG